MGGPADCIGLIASALPRRVATKIEQLATVAAASTVPTSLT
jgi:hypothetical protein